MAVLFTQNQKKFQPGVTVTEVTAPVSAFSQLTMTTNIATADLQDATKSFTYTVDVLDVAGGTKLFAYDGFTWTGGSVGKNGQFNQSVDSIEYQPISGKPLRITLTVINNAITMGFTVSAA